MKRIKTIITTDVEVDDMNSLIHLCLYLNEFDLLGVIYTSSQYHFLGDGVHTLGEVNPNYRTSGNIGLQRPRTWFTTDPDGKDLKEFRPFEKGWIEKLWMNQYAEAYPNLIKHDSRYPSPEYLLSITKYGNIEFEGDVRFDTEGSDFIKEILLNDDENPIYLQSWGGVNTIVRALLSIYETYHDTDKWDDVYGKVIKKTRLSGVFNYIGQDSSYLTNRINELYPDLILLRPEFFYGGYRYNDLADEEYRYMFQSEWMLNNIHLNNGPLMSEYHLYGDGKYVQGEPDIYQFGINSTMDFGKPDVPPKQYEKYTFLGEGDSNNYIPLISFGLRGLENYEYGTLLGRLNVFGKEAEVHEDDIKKGPFTRSYQEDWAARARWCVCDYEHANHAPVVKLSEYDINAEAGQSVTVKAAVSDPDGDDVTLSWEFYSNFSHYRGNEKLKLISDGSSVTVKLPADAEKGDWFSMILRARDNNERPMTTYGQAIIHII